MRLFHARMDFRMRILSPTRMKNLSKFREIQRLPVFNEAGHFLQTLRLNAHISMKTTVIPRLPPAQMNTIKFSVHFPHPEKKL